MGLWVMNVASEPRLLIINGCHVKYKWYDRFVDKKWHDTHFYIVK